MDFCLKLLSAHHDQPCQGEEPEKGVQRGVKQDCVEQGACQSSGMLEGGKGGGRTEKNGIHGPEDRREESDPGSFFPRWLGSLLRGDECMNHSRFPMSGRKRGRRNFKLPLRGHLPEWPPFLHSLAPGEIPRSEPTAQKPLPDILLKEGPQGLVIAGNMNFWHPFELYDPRLDKKKEPRVSLSGLRIFFCHFMKHPLPKRGSTTIRVRAAWERDSGAWIPPV